MFTTPPVWFTAFYVFYVGLPLRFPTHGCTYVVTYALRWLRYVPHVCTPCVYVVVALFVVVYVGYAVVCRFTVVTARVCCCRLRTFLFVTFIAFGCVTVVRSHWRSAFTRLLRARFHGLRFARAVAGLYARLRLLVVFLRLFPLRWLRLLPDLPVTHHTFCWCHAVAGFARLVTRFRLICCTRLRTRSVACYVTTTAARLRSAFTFI